MSARPRPIPTFGRTLPSWLSRCRKIHREPGHKKPPCIRTGGLRCRSALLSGGFSTMGWGASIGIPPDGDHPSDDGQRGESHRSRLTLGASPECVGDVPSVLWQWAMSLPPDGGSSFSPGGQKSVHWEWFDAPGSLEPGAFIARRCRDEPSHQESAADQLHGTHGESGTGSWMERKRPALSRGSSARRPDQILIKACARRCLTADAPGG